MNTTTNPAITTPQPAPLPDLAARMRDLDAALIAAVNAAAAAHSEARRLHQGYMTSDPPLEAMVALSWGGVMFLGDIIEELRTIRGRL